MNTKTAKADALNLMRARLHSEIAVMAAARGLIVKPDKAGPYTEAQCLVIQRAGLPDADKLAQFDRTLRVIDGVTITYWHRNAMLVELRDVARFTVDGPRWSWDSGGVFWIESQYVESKNTGYHGPRKRFTKESSFLAEAALVLNRAVADKRTLDTLMAEFVRKRKAEQRHESRRRREQRREGSLSAALAVVALAARGDSDAQMAALAIEAWIECGLKADAKRVNELLGTPTINDYCAEEE